MLDNECQTIQFFIEYRASSIEYQGAPATHGERQAASYQKPAASDQRPEIPLDKVRFIP
jgi:hypothetical protein